MENVVIAQGLLSAHLGKQGKVGPENVIYHIYVCAHTQHTHIHNTHTAHIYTQMAHTHTAHT